MLTCEENYGCFQSCSGDACDAVVLWRRQNNVVDFKIKSRLTIPDSRWIAIGFSKEGKMVCFLQYSYLIVFLYLVFGRKNKMFIFFLYFQDETSVVMCLHENDKFSVIEGINDGYSFYPLPKVCSCQLFYQ
jgi:hypothetical protein